MLLLAFNNGGFTIHLVIKYANLSLHGNYTKLSPLSSVAKTLKLLKLN